jgi:hypothetical protein
MIDGRCGARGKENQRKWQYVVLLVNMKPLMYLQENLG